MLSSSTVRSANICKPSFITFVEKLQKKMSEHNLIIFLVTIFKTLRKYLKQTHPFRDFGDICVKKESWHNFSKSHIKKVETCLIVFSIFFQSLL